MASTSSPTAWAAPAAGAVASRLAVDAIQRAYQEPTADKLVAAIEEANTAIHDRGSADPDLHGMGTTVTAAALMDVGASEGGVRQQVVVVNVGDSRTYLFRQGDLTQLTEDHSMVADLVRQGRIDPDDADTHPQRNIVTRVLGVYPDVVVDVWPVDPVRGDRFVLCSDGLFNELDDDQMAALLRRYEDPRDAAAELVRRAVEAGGHDNVTAIVVDVVDDGGVAEAASAALAGQTSVSRAVVGDDTSEETDRPATSRAAKRGLRRAEREERRTERSKRSHITWRVVLFSLLLIGLFVGVYLTIVWYGTSTYFVSFAGDEVVIYKGRPGGVLWIDPELVGEGTDIFRDELPPRTLDRVEAEREQSSLAKARAVRRQRGEGHQRGERPGRPRPPQPPRPARPRPRQPRP